MGKGIHRPLAQGSVHRVSARGGINLIIVRTVGIRRAGRRCAAPVSRRVVHPAAYSARLARFTHLLRRANLTVHPRDEPFAEFELPLRFSPCGWSDSPSAIFTASS